MSKTYQYDDNESKIKSELINSSDKEVESPIEIKVKTHRIDVVKTQRREMKIESQQSNESLENKNNPEISRNITTKRTKIKDVTP
jgi:hypothetical protein